MNPFVDFDGLSSEEQIKKLIELRKKLVAAHRAGASGDVLGQMQAVIEQLEFTMKDQQTLKDFQAQQKGKDPFSDFIFASTSSTYFHQVSGCCSAQPGWGARISISCDGSEADVTAFPEAGSTMTAFTEELPISRPSSM